MALCCSHKWNFCFFVGCPTDRIRTVLFETGLSHISLKKNSLGLDYVSYNINMSDQAQKLEILLQFRHFRAHNNCFNTFHLLNVGSVPQRQRLTRERILNAVYHYQFQVVLKHLTILHFSIGIKLLLFVLCSCSDFRLNITK